jgi:hypothetical protein
MQTTNEKGEAAEQAKEKEIEQDSTKQSQTIRH